MGNDIDQNEGKKAVAGPDAALQHAEMAVKSLLLQIFETTLFCLITVSTAWEMNVAQSHADDPLCSHNGSHSLGL